MKKSILHVIAVLLFGGIAANGEAPLPRPTIQASAPGGAFLEQETLRFHIGRPNMADIPYSIENWQGRIIAEGNWPAHADTIELKLPERGHFLLKSGGFTCPFAILPEPHADDPEQCYALDTHFSWTGGSNAAAGYPGDTGYDVTLELIRRAGANSIRDRISWADTNPERGRFDWKSYEKTIRLLGAHHLQAVSLYHDAPDWSKLPGVDGRPLNRRLPDDPFAVHDYNQALARKFAREIPYWEFWNEPDIGFAENPAWEYAAMLKAASLGFRAGNPEARVLIGAGSCSSPRGYLETVLKNGVNGYFDLFNYHTYDAIASYGEQIAEFRKIFRECGIAESTPIWYSEIGTRTEGPAELPGLRPGEKEHSFRQELIVAAFLPKAMAELQFHGVSRIYFYNLMPVNEWGGSKAWGLLRHDYTIKAGYTAFAVLADQLGDRRLLGKKELAEGVSAYLYGDRKNPQERQTLLLFSENGKTHRLPVPPVTDAIDWSGGALLKNTDGTLTVNSMPCYLRGLSGLSADLPAFPTAAAPPSTAKQDQTVILLPRFPKEFLLSSGKDALYPPDAECEIILEVYNLDSVAKKGVVYLSGANAPEAPRPITLPPYGKTEVSFLWTPRFPENNYRQELIAHGIVNDRPVPVALVPLIDREQLAKVCHDVPLPQANIADNWQANSSGTMRIAPIPNENGIDFSVEFPENVDCWAFPQYRLQLPQESLQGAAGIAFELRRPDDQLPTPLFARVNARWPGRLAGAGFAPSDGEWRERRVFFTPDFDLNRVECLEIGFNPGSRYDHWQIRNVRIFYLR